VRTRNEEWLVRWEATPPGFENPRTSWADRQSVGIYTQMMRSLKRQGREGSALPFAITYENRFCGQLTVGNVVRGAFNSAYVGYWVDQAVAGRGVMPTALALVVDHCFGAARLHRIEANIRPENVASRRVVEKLGIRQEGIAERFLEIDGVWEDHVRYAITSEEWTVREPELAREWLLPPNS
jgi:[ribosomal protein S5]-alanine N-acetyltransferase